MACPKTHLFLGSSMRNSQMAGINNCLPTEPSKMTEKRTNTHCCHCFPGGKDPIKPEMMQFFRVAAQNFKPCKHEENVMRSIISNVMRNVPATVRRIRHLASVPAKAGPGYRKPFQIEPRKTEQFESNNICVVNL